MRVAPTLTTDRLIIQPISLGHWEAYAAAWANPRMTEFIGGEPRNRTTSWGKFLQGIGRWSLFGSGYWSFVDRANGKLLGHGGLAQLERGIAGLEGFPEAGWAFVPDTWGRGLATEAMAAILAWADTELKATEVGCIIDPGNAASERVAAKVGFIKIGEAEDAIGRTNLYSCKPR